MKDGDYGSLIVNVKAVYRDISETDIDGFETVHDINRVFNRREQDFRYLPELRIMCSYWSAKHLREVTTTHLVKFKANTEPPDTSDEFLKRNRQLVFFTRADPQNAREYTRLRHDLIKSAEKSLTEKLDQIAIGDVAAYDSAMSLRDAMVELARTERIPVEQNHDAWLAWCKKTQDMIVGEAASIQPLDLAGFSNSRARRAWVCRPGNPVADKLKVESIVSAEKTFVQRSAQTLKERLDASDSLSLQQLKDLHHEIASLLDVFYANPEMLTAWAPDAWDHEIRYRDQKIHGEIVIPARDVFMEAVTRFLKQLSIRDDADSFRRLKELIEFQAFVRTLENPQREGTKVSTTPNWPSYVVTVLKERIELSVFEWFVIYLQETLDESRELVRRQRYQQASQFVTDRIDRLGEIEEIVVGSPRAESISRRVPGLESVGSLGSDEHNSEKHDVRLWYHLARQAGENAKFLAELERRMITPPPQK